MFSSPGICFTISRFIQNYFLSCSLSISASKGYLSKVALTTKKFLAWGAVSGLKRTCKNGLTWFMHFGNDSSLKNLLKSFLKSALLSKKRFLSATLIIYLLNFWANYLISLLLLCSGLKELLWKNPYKTLFNKQASKPQLTYWRCPISNRRIQDSWTGNDNWLAGISAFWIFISSGLNFKLSTLDVPHDTISSKRDTFYQIFIRFFFRNSACSMPKGRLVSWR